MRNYYVADGRETILKIWARFLCKPVAQCRCLRHVHPRPGGVFLQLGLCQQGVVLVKGSGGIEQNMMWDKENSHVTS